MGASKKLWEDIYCNNESPNWINQQFEVYPNKQKKLPEINAIEIAEINKTYEQNLQIVSG